MILKSINIHNFRCFNSYKLDLASKSTVLIGKNGAGKTNLLTSIVFSLSFPFAKNVIKGSQTISTSSPDLKVAALDNKGTFDARFDKEKDDYIYPIILENTAEFNSELINWALIKEKKGGGLSSSKYKKAFEKFQHYYNTDNSKLPVFAFFSDSFPHIEANMSAYAKSILEGEKGIPRNFGYYKWDEKNNCIAIWKERYIKTYNLLNSFKRPEFSIINELNELYTKKKNSPGHENDSDWTERIDVLNKELLTVNEKREKSSEYKEINFIDFAVKNFTAPLNEAFNFINTEFQVTDIKVVGTTNSEQEIQFIFQDGKEVFFKNLPMGYKRLFSIVFDIAYRSYILNRSASPEGIVIIDEIEMHLHPTLQQEVLNRFKKTFPEIQFIVSTHSSLVISNLKTDMVNDKIVRLINEGNKYAWEVVNDIYGIDYTTGVTDVMGAQYRSSDIDNLIDSYVILKLRNQNNEAQQIWNEIFAIVGLNNQKVKDEILEKLEANK